MWLWHFAWQQDWTALKIKFCRRRKLPEIFYFYPDAAAADCRAPGQTRPAAHSLLTWMVQREDWPLLEEKGMPRYLRLDVSKVLFLREEDGEYDEP